MSIFSSLAGYYDQILWGCVQTIRFAALAMIFGLVVAVFCALLRTTRFRILHVAVQVYVEAIRNTPFLVQIFLVFFGLPSIGLRLSPDGAALTALILNVGAYTTEIVRAGIESISKGQYEAGRALGLSKLQIFFLIVLPPALQAMYPALTSQFILSMLSTSVLSAIAAEELTAVANDIQSRNFRTSDVYLSVLFIYYGITLLFIAAFRVIDRAAFPFKFAAAKRQKHGQGV